MSLKLIQPSTPRASRTKAVALFGFRIIRSVQAKAAQIPGVLQQARSDVAAAWRESSPNA